VPAQNDAVVALWSGAYLGFVTAWQHERGRAMLVPALIHIAYIGRPSLVAAPSGWCWVVTVGVSLATWGLVADEVVSVFGQ
jgi:hypothetical protein